MSLDKYEIMGCPCVAMQESDAIPFLMSWIKAETGGYTVAINAEKIEYFNRDSGLRSIVTNSILPYPDGSGAVLGLKWLHGAVSEKVNMPAKAMEAAKIAGLRTFVIGAKEAEHQLAIENILTIYKGIDLVGHMHGYHPREVMIDAVIKSKPQLVFLSLGTPLQESLASEMVQRGDNCLVVCGGGALDILSGTVKRAPKFMVYNHLEWLYRLCADPRRIKRQLFLPLFLMRLIFFTFKGKFKES